ncbi:MAG: helix-turn-helix transcriptional regulator [Clostridia bacterium]|nr:helix-turn-helix transcriptional regulator [Clostridia bacterium]
MNFAIKSLSYALKVTGIANVHFFDFDKSFATEYDSHPFYELIFVSSGALDILSEGFSGTLEKDTLLIHAPNEKHALRAGGKAPAVIIIGFTYEGESLAPFAQPLKLGEGEIKRLAEIVKEARNVFAPPHNIPTHNMKKNPNQPYGAEQMLKILLEHFLISLHREYGAKRRQTDGVKHTFSVYQIVEYLNTKYTEKITLNELSFLFGTNRTTLCREFKAATGKTVAAYVAEKRLEEAKTRIVSSSATFTEISAALHFDSIHYFTRFFKKNTGLTPKEYRRRYG